jgi:hypothetical protein
MANEQNNRPIIFEESNREIWSVIRRLLIYILHELDKWYGYKTFRK